MDEPSISLREATADDASLILTILHAAFEEHRGRVDPPSGVHGETIESIRAKLRTGYALVGVVGGVAAGCVFYAPRGAHVYLGRLAVLPSYRHRGLGRALIEHVERRARALGVRRVQLGLRLVLTDLRAYYERLGYRFVRQGAHTGYAEPTYVVMEKDV